MNQVWGTAFGAIAAGLISMIWTANSAMAQDNISDVTVYIQCISGGSTISGTGVLVSRDGYVLTAAHVVGDASECRGSQRIADPGNTKRMIVQPSPIAGLDVALLQFADQVDYPFVTYCSIENWMIRKPIIVAGFPGKTETGAVSFRTGVLSTVRPSSKGLIETDGQTVAGMSGGPVFTEDLKSLIGIIIGAKFDQSGQVTFYGILPLARLAQQLGLTESATPCFHRTHEVEFAAGKNEWHAGDNPIVLGVRVEDGVCFLSEVRGQFNDKDDVASVYVNNGEYILGGQNRSGGQHSASARCIWYE